MATNTVEREWLGLGTMGWGVFALIALVNLFIMIQSGDTILEQVLYAGLVVAMAYGVVRFWKIVATFFVRLTR